MAFTFGAATGDDITWTESASAYGTSNRSALVCGWYYPTTLTATRCLWSVGTVNRCAIATTTSEIDLFLDRTTDSQHTTSGLGMAVNEWRFIAVLGAFSNTGPATNYRVWSSVGVDTPKPVTVNQIAGGTGNAVTSTVATIGNAGSTGTVAFQGDIGRFDYIISTDVTSLVTSGNGTISADNEAAIFDQFVAPIWQGRFPTAYASGGGNSAGITHIVADLDVSPYARSIKPAGGSSPTMDRATTVSGATVSTNRGPIQTLRPVVWPDVVRR